MTFSKLGTDLQTGHIVELPKTSRLQGLYLIGIQGTGKSGLIENLIMQDIKQQIGVCVLDPHGELIEHVIARLPDKQAEDKVIYLDINDYEHPFGLNVFTCPDLTDPFEVQKTIDKVEHIFEKLLGVSTETPLILEYLLRCTQTLIANPGYTMADIPLLLADSRCRQHLVANVTDTDVLLFWRRFDQMKATEQQVATASTLRRVGRFLQPLTRNIVGQSISSIDLQDIMNEGKILLVKLSTQVPSVAELIGSVIIALFLNAAPLRSANKRKQFHLYADEFQRFATEDFATLLEEARKFGIGTTIAHQNRSQLDAENKQLETNLKDRSRSVGNLVVFRVNSKDADDLAGEFDITPEEAWEEELEQEWFERVEEDVIDGEEEIDTPVKDVVGHLLRGGSHPDPVVNEFTQEWLQKLSEQYQKQCVNTVLYDGMMGKDWWESYPDDLMINLFNIADLVTFNQHQDYVLKWFHALLKTENEIKMGGKPSLFVNSDAYHAFVEYLRTGSLTERDTLYDCVREYIRNNLLYSLKAWLSNISIGLYVDYGKFPDIAEGNIEDAITEEMLQTLQDDLEQRHHLYKYVSELDWVDLDLHKFRWQIVKYGNSSGHL